MESLAMAVLDWQPLGSGAGGWWTWHAAKALIAAGGLVAVSCATETLYYRGLVGWQVATQSACTSPTTHDMPCVINKMPSKKTSCLPACFHHNGHLQVALEKAGVIERLAPQIKTTVVSYTHQVLINAGRQEN
jgi:hypothetical protein